MCMYAKLCLTLCGPMDCACQYPLSTGFSRQEYWNGLPFPSPGDISDPEVEPVKGVFYVSCISRQVLSHLGHPANYFPEGCTTLHSQEIYEI